MNFAAVLLLLALPFFPLRASASPAAVDPLEAAESEARVVLAAGGTRGGGFYRRLTISVAANIARTHIEADPAAFGLGAGDELGRARGRLLSTTLVALTFPAQRHRGLEVLGTELRVSVAVDEKRVVAASGRRLRADGAPLSARLSARAALRGLAGRTVSCRTDGVLEPVLIELGRTEALDLVLDPAEHPDEPALWRLRHRLIATPRADWNYSVLVDAQTAGFVSCAAF